MTINIHEYFIWDYGFSCIESAEKRLLIISGNGIVYRTKYCIDRITDLLRLNLDHAVLTVQIKLYGISTSLCKTGYGHVSVTRRT